MKNVCYIIIIFMKCFVNVIQNVTSKIIFSEQNDQEKFELKELV